ncbi:MAG: hypothetical protein ACI9SB_001650 [Candidatus Azotimanducaceae bacterium]|jgi:hypothetical protein
MMSRFTFLCRGFAPVAISRDRLSAFPRPNFFVLLRFKSGKETKKGGFTMKSPIN